MSICLLCKSPVHEGDHFCSNCGATLDQSKRQTNLDQFIGSLAGDYSLSVESRDSGAGWKIELPHRGKFICHLLIGPMATDWYAEVLDRSDRHKVWTDWMDYYGYDKKSEDQLVDDKESDIAWFVRSWVTASAVRVSDKPLFWGLTKRMILEWNHSGTWGQVQLSDPTR